MYVALFRCFEVQSEREIKSSGNGQCVVCYFFFRSPILVVTLNQLDEHFRATHETYIYLTQTTVFCGAKWTKSTNNRQFGRTIGVIECSIVRVSWCREDFQRIFFSVFFTSLVTPLSMKAGSYWVPLLPLIVYNFSGRKATKRILIDSLMLYPMLHHQNNLFRPLLCVVLNFLKHLWCDQWTVYWTNNGTFSMHKLANRVGTKTIVSSFNQRLQTQELQWNITIKYAMTFTSSFKL